jgi:hypothetical protein
VYRVDVREVLQRGHPGGGDGQELGAAQFVGERADRRSGVEQDGLAGLDLSGDPTGDRAFGLETLAGSLPQ